MRLDIGRMPWRLARGSRLQSDALCFCSLKQRSPVLYTCHGVGVTCALLGMGFGASGLQ